MIKALIMGGFGLALATVGTDVMSGIERLTFGQVFLMSGIDFVVVAMGLFAVGEILVNLEQAASADIFKVPSRLRELLPSLQDIRASAATLIRSTVLGFLIGTLPGGSPTIATFLAYGATKALAKDPEVFGTGTIRGVAAAESADNAATSGGLVPLMTLGVPGTPTTAILLAALIMAGLQPGPLLMKQQPDFFWAVVASMYIGNVLLLILNLPLVPLFANLLRVPYYILYPMILGICSVGVYSINNQVTDLWLMAAFGILGYLFKKAEFPAAPAVLALVLGRALDKSLRQSMVMFEGNPAMIFHRPISAILLALALIMLAMPMVQAVRRSQGGGKQRSQTA